MIVLAVLVSLFSCKSIEQSFKDYEGKVISIGYGGGMTGEYKEYSLVENGDMFFYNTLSKEFKYFGKVEQNVTDQIFSNSELLKLPKRIVHKPGNMNRYIKYRINKEENKIIWSKNSEVEGDLNTFYQVFLNNVKKQKK